MKLTRYTKFTGDLSTSFDLEDLLNALSDFFLDSGYQDPFSPFQNDDDSMESLKGRRAPGARLRRASR